MRVLHSQVDLPVFLHGVFGEHRLDIGTDYHCSMHSIGVERFTVTASKKGSFVDYFLQLMGD